MKEISKDKITSFVGWYEKDYKAYLSSWIGSTMTVIIAPVKDTVNMISELDQALKRPDVKVYMVDKSKPLKELVDEATAIGGCLGIAFTSEQCLGPSG